MDVIVVGFNHHNALGLIRSLGEKGHSVHLLLMRSGFNFVNKSLYIKSCYVLESFEKIIPFVKTIAKGCNSKPLLLVAGDEEATYTNFHFEELSRYCFVEGAYKDGDIAVYHNKFTSNELAKDFGFLIPKTWSLNNKQFIPKDLNYPILIKAGDSVRGGKGVLKKCFSKEDLENVLKQIPASFFPLQAQEYVHKDYEIIILGCSLNHGEQVFCPVAERKLRYYPQEFQTTAYTESLLISENKDLFDISNRISKMIKSLGYTGLFSVELIYSNHQYYFLETNFRNDGTGYLATVCGFNMPDMLCKSFNGSEVSLKLDDYRPCHYVNVIADGMNVIHRRVSIITWIKQVKNAMCYSHYSKNDKKPLLYAVLALFLNKMKR